MDQTNEAALHNKKSILVVNKEGKHSNQGKEDQKGHMHFNVPLIQSNYENHQPDKSDYPSPPQGIEREKETNDSLIHQVQPQTHNIPHYTYAQPQPRISNNYSLHQNHSNSHLVHGYDRLNNVEEISVISNNSTKTANIANNTSSFSNKFKKQTDKRLTVQMAMARVRRPAKNGSHVPNRQSGLNLSLNSKWGQGSTKNNIKNPKVKLSR